MKLTIEIPDDQVADAMRQLAELLSKPVLVGDPKESETTRPILPEGISAPPVGFIFASMDQLDVVTSGFCDDIAWFSGIKWYAVDDGSSPHGWTGSGFGPWAVRAGSKIAIENGIH